MMSKIQPFILSTQSYKFPQVNKAPTQVNKLI